MKTLKKSIAGWKKAKQLVSLMGYVLGPWCENKNMDAIMSVDTDVCGCRSIVGYINHHTLVVEWI